MICRIRNIAIFALSVFVCGWASKVIEDSHLRFVLNDEVYETTIHACDDGVRARFLPEASTTLDGVNDAYRVYHVAIPSKIKPSVRVSKVKLLPLGKPVCKSDSLKFKPLSVSEPYFRDGLWISEIIVPLFEKKGISIALRKSFELSVEFAQATTGVYPGTRAIGRVVNPKGAARFGVNLGKKRKALRRAAQSELEDVEFVANIMVGDRNVASFTEDGQIAVDYKTINKALALQGRKDELSGVLIDKICLYGANPDTLSDKVPGSDLWTPNQIFEIPIEIRDHSPSSSAPNGIFDGGDLFSDTIVFVGYGTSIWKRSDREDPLYKNGAMDYFHSYSPYSFYQSFSLGVKSLGKGLRISILSSPTSNGKSIPLMRYVRAEKEKTLRDSYFGKDLEWDEKTGKEWFWQWHCRFDTTIVSDLNFPQTSNLPGFVKGGKNYVAISYYPHRSVWKSSAERDNDQPANTGFSMMDYAFRMNGIKFNFEVNGKTFSERTLMPGGNFRLDGVNLNASNNTFLLRMLPNDVQYDRFDGYSIAYEWNPQADTAEWILPGAVSGNIQIPIGTDPKLRLMKFKDYEPQGLLKIENGFAKDNIGVGEDVRYMLYREGSYRTSFYVEGIPTHFRDALKDLSKINNKTEYLIISPTEFQNEADSLAVFRTNGSAIATFKTTLVLVEDIYRYYTGGAPSPIAIRNYIAYARSICPNLKYVLLAGYGHYDYRTIVSGLPKNYIPTFEKEDAMSEDFYAILDSGESAFYGKYDVDLSVGRLPVTSVSEFRDYRMKAMEYEKVGLYDHSEWRSSLILGSDDALNGSSIDYTKHTAIHERVAQLIDSISSQKKIKWNMKKIYLLNFKEDASGQKKDAAQQMIDAINQGALMTSYFGHASMTDLASEGLLKTSYIPRLFNKKLYTILNSFSCSTSRFDNGKRVSLTLQFVISSEVGAIASIGASRETFADFNESFAKKYVMSALFDSASTLGDAFLKGKRLSSLDYSRERYNNEHYVLFGEPVIMMPYSTGKITLDQNLDTLKALDKVRLSGSVSNMNDGMAYLMLREGRYDKKMYIGFHDESEDVFDEESRTHIQNFDQDTVKVPFEGSLIYSEKVKVQGGRFSVEFVTPRKMAFGDTAVELQTWVYSNDERPIARNWKGGIVISGMSTYADSIHDVSPPSIKIQPCINFGKTSYFSEGQSVKLQAPACLQVVLDDSTALDFREEADEGVSFEIENWQTPFHPYPYVEQSSRHAVVRMNFSSEAYPAGKYVFKVRAFDVLGNMGEKSVNIEITDDMNDGLDDLFNVPNPVGKKGTVFYFKNYAVNRSSTVNIFIYNQNGKLVKVIKNAVSGVTHWDGRDNHGNILANGLYHYVVQSKVGASGDYGKKTWTKKQKLVISR